MITTTAGPTSDQLCLGSLWILGSLSQSHIDSPSPPVQHPANDVLLPLGISGSQLMNSVHLKGMTLYCLLGRAEPRTPLALLLSTLCCLSQLLSLSSDEESSSSWWSYDDSDYFSCMCALRESRRLSLGNDRFPTQIVLERLFKWHQIWSTSSSLVPSSA